VTRDYFGPGSFEIYSQIMPRFGATSAFWTFYNNGEVNDEIDIELNVGNSFYAAWFTSWITELLTDHEEMTTPVLNNDGKYHLYRFDWHTGPIPHIDYFIDGVLYYTTYEYIPTHAMQFWIGHWFPVGWAGIPDFETAYMYVDYFRYTAFEGEDYIPVDRAVASPGWTYPSTPVALPVTNWLANGTFLNQIGWYVPEGTNITISNNQLTIIGGTSRFGEAAVVQQLTGLDAQISLVFNGDLQGDAVIKIICYDNNTDYTNLGTIIVTPGTPIVLLPNTTVIDVVLTGAGAKYTNLTLVQL
jgi:hypothetical protein